MKQLSDNGESAFVKSRSVFQKKWGEVSRVLYVTPSGEVTREELEACVSLARQGYYVTIAARSLPDPPQSLFARYDMFEHYGVFFMRYSFFLQVVWRAIFKKKKYHAIYAPSGLAPFFRVSGARVLLAARDLQPGIKHF